MYYLTFVGFININKFGDNMLQKMKNSDLIF